jgi:hypothetical protein
LKHSNSASANAVAKASKANKSVSNQESPLVHNNDN